MYAVAIRFPAHRMHATAWGHHVNEGTVEWPPSPLRLLRALTATGFKLGWEPERTRAAVLSLTSLPVYRMPPATAGHTRHYMPTDGLIETDRRLIFDAFYAIDEHDALGVAWPHAQPNAAIRADLDLLWQHVAYLGRAEAWVVCEPLADIGEPNARPGDDGDEIVTLPAVETDEALDAWRVAHPQPKGKKKGPWSPNEAWDVVCLDLADVQKAGWSRAPGVREVSYVLRDTAIVSPVRQNRELPRQKLHLALYALASNVPPRLDRTVSIGDRTRRAAMSKSTWFDDEGHGLLKEHQRTDPETLLTGKDTTGQPLSGHRHAFWLPFSAQGTPVLDRLLVWVRDEEGLSARAEQALRALTKTWGDEQHDIHTILLGFDGDARVGAEALIGPATTWVTDTPFVPTRYPKKGKDGIAEQVRRAVAQLGLPDPRAVEPLEIGAHGVEWHHFHTARRGGGAQAMQRGYGVRLVFTEPVEGPIAIGWGAHYGMGRFRRMS